MQKPVTGGALLKYTYQGELNAEEVADEASALLGRLTTAQVTKDLNTGENRVVLNLAGEYGMSSAEQDDFLVLEQEARRGVLSGYCEKEPATGHAPGLVLLEVVGEDDRRVVVEPVDATDR